MTCIVGLVDGERVLIGGDSMANDGCAYDLRRDPKVFRVGEMVIGCSGEPRTQDVAHYLLEPPLVDGDDMLRYMVRSFVPALRKALEEAGVDLKPGDGRSRWVMLVGTRGRLFAIYDDFQVEETLNGYGAVGCGAKVALGALHVMKATDWLATSKVRIALEAAEAVDTHVRGPFVIEAI